MPKFTFHEKSRTEIHKERKLGTGRGGKTKGEREREAPPHFSQATGSFLSCGSMLVWSRRPARCRCRGPRCRQFQHKVSIVRDGWAGHARGTFLAARSMGDILLAPGIAFKPFFLRPVAHSHTWRRWWG